MKNYPVAFSAKKNAKTGSNPIWLLVLDDGVTTYYISDRVVTVKNLAGADVTTVAWVSSWGELIEGISNLIGEFSIGELRIHLLNDPNNAANIIHIIDNHDIETNPAYLCCWFYGIADPCQAVFCGYVREINIDGNDSGVELLLQDFSLKAENIVGHIITRTNYPLAEPSEIGKLVPIPFGVVNKLRAVYVDCGWVTAISVAITITDTVIYVSELFSATTVGKTVYIDNEQLYITAENSITKALTVTRGYNSTTAATHAIGSVVIEKKSTPLVFLCGDIPVTNIGTIYVRVRGIDIDITSSCTKYLGSADNQLAAFPDKAAITIATTPNIMRDIDLAIINGLNVNQGNHTHASSTSVTTLRPTGAGSVYGGTSANNWNNTMAQNSWDGNAATSMTGPAQANYSEVTTVPGIGNLSIVRFYYSTVNNLANCLRIRVGVIADVSGNYGNAAFGLVIQGSLVASGVIPQGSAKNTFYTGWANFTSMATLYNYGGASATSYAFCNISNISTRYLYEIWFEIETGVPIPSSAATGVMLTGDVSLIGNSVANVDVIDALLCNVVNANQNTPKSTCDWLLTNYGPPGIIACSSDNTIHTTVGNLNSAIINQKPVSYWLNRIAFEFRSRFKWNITGAALMYRADVLASSKTATQAQTNNFNRRLSDYEDIINTINLKYARDWSSSDAEPYTQVVSLSDATSQSRFGFREKSDLFRFDFITDATLAANIAAWYLAHYKSRHWIVTLELFLDNMELEFMDDITIEVFANQIGEIMEARLRPGDDQTPDGITIIVEM